MRKGSDGMHSPMKELNMSQRKQEYIVMDDPSSSDWGSVKDSNVHPGPAGTPVWAGPPSNVSLPGVVPVLYQDTIHPEMDDPLRFHCPCKSAECHLTYPHYLLEPQSSQYHLLNGPVPGQSKSSHHSSVSAQWFSNDPILCSTMPVDLHAAVASICVSEALDPQQFNDGLTEFPSNITQPIPQHHQTAYPLYESQDQSANMQPQAPQAQAVGPLCESKFRKPCHCNRSLCLKLYCECFANGVMCSNCDCTNCHNNAEHEMKRHKAIKLCLGRNPGAFKSKIAGGKLGEVKGWHNKGCNCKRSSCLKNYCECYEAHIKCTSSCKCVGCKNYDNSSESALNEKTVNVMNKWPVSVITPAVVEAVSSCLLAQAEEAEREAQSYAQAEHMVLEEFGHCLSQIAKAMFKSSI